MYAHVARALSRLLAPVSIAFGRRARADPNAMSRRVAASPSRAKDGNAAQEPENPSTSSPTDDVTTPISAKQNSRKKPVKTEDERSVVAIEPEGWEKTLETIKRWRADGPPAAVDTMGCEKIADVEDDRYRRYLTGSVDAGRYRRYLTLTSAMLSSQTKDEINHAAMRRLRAHGCTPENILNTDEDALDAMINPVGFHRRKAQYLRATAKILLDEYDGDIPPSVETLCALPGVGPKMAYLVMNVGWGEPTGICVDVHVHRISERLGWVAKDVMGKNGSPRKKTPEDTRAALESWLPKHEWIEINPLLVGFGQLTCTQLSPKCHACPLAKDGSCPSAFKENPASPESAKKRPKLELKLEGDDA